MKYLILFLACFLILSSHAHGQNFNITNKVIRGDSPSYIMKKPPNISVKDSQPAKKNWILPNKTGEKTTITPNGAGDTWNDRIMGRFSSEIQPDSKTQSPKADNYQSNGSSVARGRDPAIEDDPEKPIDPYPPAD